MNDASTSTSGSNAELLRLFWLQFDHGRGLDDGTPDQQDAAQRIVTAVGPTPTAVSLAATFANEFRLALPMLADALERPSEETLLLTVQPPTGSALVAATAARLGQQQQSEGNLPGAERSFRWARREFHALGDQSAESFTLTFLGRVVEMQDRLNEAAQYYMEALTIDRAVGDHFNEGVDLGLLGQVAWLRGQLDDAERLAREALALQRGFGSRPNRATTLTTLGEVARARGQHWRARFYFLQSALARRGLR